MTILYRTPPDEAEFRRYYLEQHVPIARRMRGLTGWNLQWLDADGDRHGYVLVAELSAESRSAMDAILASPEGRAASADLDEFASAGVEFLTGDVDEVDLDG